MRIALIAAILPLAACSAVTHTTHDREPRPEITQPMPVLGDCRPVRPGYSGAGVLVQPAETCSPRRNHGTERMK